VRAAATRDRLVLLASPLERIGPVRLQVVDDQGRLRSVELHRVKAGYQNPPDWDRPGAYGISRDAGLAVDPDGGRAFVIAADAPVAEVDLASLRVTYRHLRQPASLLRRMAHWLVPPAQAKQVAGAWRSACWLGEGTLAVWGASSSITGATVETQRQEVRRSGLKLIDTRGWTVRTLDPAAETAGWRAGRLLTFGGTWDHEAQRENGAGVTIHGPGGRPQQHLLGTRAVMDAQLNGDLLYASVDLGREEHGRVVASLRDGRVVASSLEPLPFLLVHQVGPAC